MMADTGRWPVAWSTIRSAAVGAGNSGIEQDGRKSDLRVGGQPAGSPLLCFFL